MHFCFCMWFIWKMMASNIKWMASHFLLVAASWMYLHICLGKVYGCTAETYLMKASAKLYCLAPVICCKGTGCSNSAICSADRAEGSFHPWIRFWGACSLRWGTEVWQLAGLAAASQMYSAWDTDHLQTFPATRARKHIISVSPYLPPGFSLNN